MGAIIGFLAFRPASRAFTSRCSPSHSRSSCDAFDHIDGLGGPGGSSCASPRATASICVAFRGPPAMYYYAMLGLAGGALALCAWLLRRRAGYYWRAIREDEVAAQAVGIDTFWWKMRAVVLSAVMTSIAGVFYAFYYNSLFPEQIFSFTRSIEIILGPVVGGLGTLFGPIIGAAALVLLGDGTTEVLAKAGFDIPGAKQVVSWRGVAAGDHFPAERDLAAARPYPRFRGEEGCDVACWSSKTSANRFVACALLWARASGSEGHHRGLDRAERRREDDDLQPDRGGVPAGPRRHPAGRPVHRGLPAGRCLRGGYRSDLSAGQAFRGPVCPRQRDGGALHSERTSRGRPRAKAVLGRLGLAGKAAVPPRV